MIILFLFFFYCCFLLPFTSVFFYPFLCCLILSYTSQSFSLNSIWNSKKCQFLVVRAEHNTDVVINSAYTKKYSVHSDKNKLSNFMLHLSLITDYVEDYFSDSLFVRASCFSSTVFKNMRLYHVWFYCVAEKKTLMSKHLSFFCINRKVNKLCTWDIYLHSSVCLSQVILMTHDFLTPKLNMLLTLQFKSAHSAGSTHSSTAVCALQVLLVTSPHGSRWAPGIWNWN